MAELGQWLAACRVASPMFFAIGAGAALLVLFMPGPGRTHGMALDLKFWTPRIEFKSPRRMVLSILAVAASLLVAAGLAEPQITAKPSYTIYGKPGVIVLDISGSMGAKPQRYAGDYMPADTRNGYQKARDVFDDLIGRRPDVNFALLLYSSERYLARYFTYKNELLADTIDNEKEIEDISTGTRTAEALVAARQFLTDQVQGKDKAIVLISDLEGDPEAILQMAEEMEREVLAGIRVYVITITSDRKTPSRPHAIAGVQFVDMNDSAGIARILGDISEMQNAPLRQEPVLQKISLIPYLVLSGLGSILVAVFLSENALCKIP